jgi:Helix-turn-helix domain
VTPLALLRTVPQTQPGYCPEESERGRLVVYYAAVGEDTVRGNEADTNREIEAPSGWVGTQQAARTLGVSPRTVRWHIDQGNLVAKPEGEGVRRTWLVSIDSLQAFRNARQSVGSLPRADRIGELAAC